jgi:hypothetical protein
MSLAYVILGSPPTALAEFVREVARALAMEEGAPRLLAAADHREALGELAGARFWEEGAPLPSLDADTIGSEAPPVLLVPASATDPRPFLEHLREWLERHERPLSRVFTLVDCAALEADPAWQPYYDVCLHFSDVLLLANRENVSKKWIQEYRNRLHKQAVPALVELLKKGGRVADLPALLYPEARRLTQFFDEPEGKPDLPIEIEGFGADEETQDPRDPEFDPFLQRGEDGSYRFRFRLPQEDDPL